MSRIKPGGSVVPTVPRAIAPRRPPGAPEQMRWRPLITFIQTAMDAANAMVSVPGEFGSFGHDYRADMVRFVRDAYALPAASDAQVARIEAVLRSLELERAERIKATHAQAAPAGVLLRIRRTRGTRWSQRRSTPQPDSSRFVGRTG